MGARAGPYSLTSDVATARKNLSWSHRCEQRAGWDGGTAAKPRCGNVSGQHSSAFKCELTEDARIPRSWRISAL